MDFLDSLDLDTSYKKSHRVRSWYLYEQYKSLERNQLEAAQRLKDRTYQDKLLHQELFERRARRKLYNQFEQCHSEGGIESIKSKSESKCLSVSDDVLECCDLEDDRDDRVTQLSERDFGDMCDTFSQDGSHTTRECDRERPDGGSEDYKSSESVPSVMANYMSEPNHADDLKELELVKQNITENLNLQLETVKESLQCIESFSKLKGENEAPKYEDDDSVTSLSPYMSKCKMNPNYDNNLYNMWSKLVSFAYQVIQLNHGNCYYDYSSQFLTAVLACDVLRRGVNRMCDILQPYVSPIKFATDKEQSSSSEPRAHHTHTIANRKCERRKGTKIYIPLICQDRTGQKSKEKCKRCLCKRGCRSEALRQISFSIRDVDSDWANKRKNKRSSEPRRSIGKFSSKHSPHSSSTIWPKNREYSRQNSCCTQPINNPMLKLGNYIDSLMKAFDETI